MGKNLKIRKASGISKDMERAIILNEQPEISEETEIHENNLKFHLQNKKDLRGQRTPRIAYGQFYFRFYHEIKKYDSS